MLGMNGENNKIEKYSPSNSNGAEKKGDDIDKIDRDRQIFDLRLRIQRAEEAVDRGETPAEDPNDLGKILDLVVNQSRKKFDWEK